MEITINGELKNINSGNVLELLTALGLDPKLTVVEQNGTIISRDSYAETIISKFDNFELIRFMGGG